MSLLVVKIAGLALLAALLGACLGWWMARRHLQELALEHARQRADWAQWRQELDRRLAERQSPDFTPVMHRLGALEKAVGGIRLPTPEPINLRPVLDAVASLRRPDLQPVNLEPLHARLLAVEDSIRRIHIPVPRETDLSPLMASLLQLQRMVGAQRQPPAAGAIPETKA